MGKDETCSWRYGFKKDSVILSLSICSVYFYVSVFVSNSRFSTILVMWKCPEILFICRSVSMVTENHGSGQNNHKYLSFSRKSSHHSFRTLQKWSLGFNLRVDVKLIDVLQSKHDSIESDNNHAQTLIWRLFVFKDRSRRYRKILRAGEPVSLQTSQRPQLFCSSSLHLCHIVSSVAWSCTKTWQTKHLRSF